MNDLEVSVEVQHFNHVAPWWPEVKDNGKASEQVAVHNEFAWLKGDASVIPEVKAFYNDALDPGHVLLY